VRVRACVGVRVCVCVRACTAAGAQTQRLAQRLTVLRAQQTVNEQIVVEADTAVSDLTSSPAFRAAAAAAESQRTAEQKALMRECAVLSADREAAKAARAALAKRVRAF